MRLRRITMLSHHPFALILLLYISYAGESYNLLTGRSQTAYTVGEDDYEGFGSGEEMYNPQANSGSFDDKGPARCRAVCYSACQTHNCANGECPDGTCHCIRCADGSSIQISGQYNTVQ